MAANSPLAVEHLFERSHCYHMIIALDPRVLLVTHIGRIVAGVNGADMIDDRVQRETKVAIGIVFLGHKGRHIELDGKLNERRYFAINQCRMLETLQMERDDAGQGAQAKLFGGLLVRFAGGAFDFGRRAEMLGTRIALQAVNQRLRRDAAVRGCLAEIQ